MTLFCCGDSQRRRRRPNYESFGGIAVSPVSVFFVSVMFKWLIVVAIIGHCTVAAKDKRCRILGAKNFSPNDLENYEERFSQRTAHQDVYLWPNINDHEKDVIRAAFDQIERRTCIRFNELDFKPWYHADRWDPDKPYGVIRKSKKFSGYTDNTVEEVTQRSIIYLTEKALNEPNFNNSRGMVMDQLLRYMGYREEFLRPDAASYIKAVRPLKDREVPHFSPQQLDWPFDPESITMPSAARNWYELTVYCPARKTAEIGAGQRTGLLTRWDAVKLNSMYCPERVGNVDPAKGPCVVPRKRNR